LVIEATFSLKNDDADFAETARIRPVGTAPHAASRILGNNLGTLWLPEVVHSHTQLVARVHLNAEPYPAVSVKSASSFFSI
jgi:hypothetical protein